MAAVDEAGELIAGRYRVEEEISTGGQALVVRAWDTDLDERVVLKLAAVRRGVDAEVLRARLKNEVKISRKVSSDHIVRCYTFDEGHDPPFLVMEYVPGSDLRRLVDHMGGSLPEADVARIGSELCDALHSAHQAGVIHRDVKPANVLVTDQGAVKLTDFGIARFQDGPGVTLPMMQPGDPEFASPEQLRAEELTRATDVWSLCATLAWAATGRPVQQTVPYVPHEGSALSQILALGLAHEPLERTSVESLRATLVTLGVDVARGRTPTRRHEGANDIRPNHRPRRQVDEATGINTYWKAPPELATEREGKWRIHMPNKLRAVIDRPRVLVLRFLSRLYGSRRRWPAEIAAPLVLAAIGRLILVPFIGATAKSAGPEGAWDAVIVVLAFLLKEWGEALWLGPLRESEREIGKLASDPKNGVILRRLAVARMREIPRVLVGLLGDGYEASRPEQLRQWLNDFFTLTSRTYVGVDSNVPGKYMTVYDWYLEIHGRSLRRRRAQAPQRDARIVVATKEALDADYWDSREKSRGDDNLDYYSAFVTWHEENDVELLWLEPFDAQYLCAKWKLPTVDAGLWEGECGVLFTGEEGAKRVAVRAPERENAVVPSYASIAGYVDEAREKAQPFRRGPLETVGAKLAERWEEYVDPGERLAPDGPLARFLLEVLGPLSAGGRVPIVLDAGAGIACDAMFLLDHGFSVVANEVDPHMEALARNYVGRFSGERPEFTSYMWEQLGDRIRGHIRFDAVVVMGNSLCQVLDETHREQALRGFFEVLQPGGTLIIDERNFEDMITRRDEIFDDPQSFAHVRGDDPMYRGVTVRGYPWEISRQEVLWRIFDNGVPVTSRSEIEQRKIGDLKLHPFAYGELSRLLRVRHFEEIAVYADLELVSRPGDPLPRPEEVSNATFLTYVARKPGGSK